MTSQPKATDRRVLRTKKNIRQTFLQLLSEKSLTQLTVKELSERADINRKTFYMYYSNIEEILSELEDELVQKLVLVFEKELFEYLDTRYPEIPKAIAEEKVISDATDELLKKAITEFKAEFKN